MNKARKNVVVVGFSLLEQNSLGLPSIPNNKVHFVASMKEAYPYQGYLLIFKNETKMSLTDFDKKYRKVLKKFARIWFYHPSYTWHEDKFSRIEKVNNAIFADASYSLGEEWDEYARVENHRNQKQRTRKKDEQLERLYGYLKQYRTRKTLEIAKDLDMSPRKIERYMEELNQIYASIGYDYKEKEWYFIW